MQRAIKIQIHFIEFYLNTEANNCDNMFVNA